jgi:hypothetical protein
LCPCAGLYEHLGVSINVPTEAVTIYSSIGQHEGTVSANMLLLLYLLKVGLLLVVVRWLVILLQVALPLRRLKVLALLVLLCSSCWSCCLVTALVRV